MFLIYANGKFIGTSPNQGSPLGETVPVPPGFDMRYLRFYEMADGVAVLNHEGARKYALELRIARIKEEAYERIAATDWRLSRATEREDAGWDSLEGVNEVLAERESIRASSNQAEVNLNRILGISDIENFEWKNSTVVPPPRRISRHSFLGRFKPSELESLVAAKAYNPMLAAWVIRIENVAYINLDDPDLLPALEALEALGLLAEGRSTEILS